MGDEQPQTIEDRVADLERFTSVVLSELDALRDHFDALEASTDRMDRELDTTLTSLGLPREPYEE